jgi:hypothetical protein
MNGSTMNLMCKTRQQGLTLHYARMLAMSHKQLDTEVNANPKPEVLRQESAN